MAARIEARQRKIATEAVVVGPPGIRTAESVDFRSWLPVSCVSMDQAFRSRSGSVRPIVAEKPVLQTTHLGVVSPGCLGAP